MTADDETSSRSPFPSVPIVQIVFESKLLAELGREEARLAKAMVLPSGDHTAREALP